MFLRVVQLCLLRKPRIFTHIINDSSLKTPNDAFALLSVPLRDSYQKKKEVKMEKKGREEEKVLPFSSFLPSEIEKERGQSINRQRERGKQEKEGNEEEGSDEYRAIRLLLQLEMLVVPSFSSSFFQNKKRRRMKLAGRNYSASRNRFSNVGEEFTNDLFDY